LAFRIPESGTLEFDLPTNVEKLRVFAHGELRDEVTGPDVEASRDLALRLRFEGWKGDSLERTYHFRSRISPSVGIDGRVRPNSRYLRSKARPLDVRGAVLSLRGIDFRPARMLISVADLDPGLAGASVRVYFEETIAKSNALALWSRLSISDRVRRAAGNIYPHYLLTSSEREALISARWLPVAPSGVPGEDYERRIVLLARQGLPALDRSDARTLALPEGVFGIVRLAPGPSVEIEAAVLEGEAGSIRATLFSEDGATAEPIGVETDDGTDRAVLQIKTGGEAGWLSIEAPGAMTVRTIGSGGQISPLQIESIQMFDCSVRPIEYRVVHLPGQTTPMRIDLRSAGEGVEAVSRFRLLSASGEVVGEGPLAARPELSRYDWVERDGVRARVSEVSRTYVSVPIEAERLEVTCEEGTYVALYNQEPDLVLRSVLPATEESATRRRWAPLLPLGGPVLTAEGLTARLLLQRRPPVGLEKEGTTPGDSSLKSYELGSGQGRHLLVPMAAPSGTGTSWRYRGVSDSVATTLTLSESNRNSVEPTVLFRRESEAPFRIVGEIDGEIVFEEETAGFQGEFRLPKLRSGSRRVELRGDGETRFFINRVSADGGEHFVRRFVEALPRKPFEITVDKRGSAVVTGRLYFASDAAGSCRIETSVASVARPVGEPLDDWTYPRRVYEIDRTQQGRIAQLGSDERWVGASEPFFVRIGNDLPDGPIRVRITPLCSESIYLTLSKLVSGTTVERRLIFESSLEEPL